MSAETTTTQPTATERQVQTATLLLQDAPERYAEAIDKVTEQLKEGSAAHTITWKADDLVAKEMAAEIARYIFGEDGEGDGKPIAMRLQSWIDGKRQTIEMGLAVRGTSRSTNGFDREVEQVREMVGLEIYGKLTAAGREG